MIVMKFDFKKIFSLSYMGKLCCLQNVLLLLWYKYTFIDSYCLLQYDYIYFHLCLLWVDSVIYINCQSTCGYRHRVYLVPWRSPCGYKHGVYYESHGDLHVTKYTPCPYPHGDLHVIIHIHMETSMWLIIHSISVST